MAINTENRRRSAGNHLAATTYPAPTGSVQRPDRPHASWIYSGIPFASGLFANIQGRFGCRTPVFLLSLAVKGTADPTKSVTFLFSSQEAPPLNLQLGMDVRPTLVSVEGRTTRIRPEKALTERARVTAVFREEPDAQVFDSTVFTPFKGGGFWQRLLVAQPDLVGSEVLIKRGYVDPVLVQADFKTIFKGRLEDVDIRNDLSVAVKFIDSFAFKDAEVPAEITDKNKVEQVNLNAADANFTVSSGSEITDPSTLDSKDVFPVVLRLDPDGTLEDVIISDVTGNVVTVQENLLRRSEEFDNAVWTKSSGSVFIFQDLDSTPFGGPPFAEALAFGVVGDFIEQDTLNVGTGVSGLFSVWLRVVPPGSPDTITLEVILSDATEVFSACVPVTDAWTRFEIGKTFVAGAGQTMRARIKRGPLDAVVVQAFGAQFETGKTSGRGFYAATQTQGTSGAGRGAYGTTAAAHDAGVPFKEIVQYRHQLSDDGIHPVIILRDLVNRGGTPVIDVDQSTFDTEFNFNQSPRFRRSGLTVMTESTKLSDLIKQVREQAGLDLWVSEGGLVRTRFNFRPNVPGDEVVTLTDETNIVRNSSTYKGNAKDRVTRALVYFGPKTAEVDGDKPKDFNEVQVVVDLAVEVLSGAKSRSLFSLWIFREQEALAIAGRLVSRFRRGARVASWTLDLKDDLDIDVGDLVRLDSIDLFQLSDTTAGLAERGKTFWRITRKKDKSRSGTFEVEALQQSTLRYGIIGASGLPDFGTASDADKKFGYIGDSDNLVGSPAETGYFIL